MPRFFVPPDAIQGQTFTLKGPEARHAALVLRKKAGDVIDLFDGRELSYQGRIVSITSDDIVGVLLSQRQAAVSEHPPLVLFQSLIKAPKWDWLVEKACEIGVSELIPVLTERTTVRLTSDGEKAKIARWSRIALAASKQCGRAEIMKVQSTMPFTKAMNHLGENALSLIPWEKEGGMTVRKACSGTTAGRVNIFIGPEGGWASDEVDLAVRAGVVPVGLGPTLLRSETAALVAATLVFSELGGYG